MQINLFESIRIFIEIVESGSLTQAAENLRVHRPAVTKALQLLEQHSGTRLLQRTTRRISLTPDGEAFYRRSKPLLAQADELLESFGADRPIHGQLRIDMPISFAALRVIPNLPDFYRQHPEIDIILSSSDRRRDMLRDGLDCVLRVGELDDGDYIARKIGNIKITTCASPAWLAQHGTPETLDDLRKHQPSTGLITAADTFSRGRLPRQKASRRSRYPVSSWWITPRPTSRQAWPGWG